MMFLLSHEPPQRLPSLYWRSQARLPTGHPLWPPRRGTCPIQVLKAQEISGNSQRAGPPGQFLMRPGQAACERYREIFIFTAGLFVVALLFTCATWKNPIAVGGSL